MPSEGIRGPSSQLGGSFSHKSVLLGLPEKPSRSNHSIISCQPTVVTRRNSLSPKAAELALEEELAKKEARRKARKEELHKMIIEGLAKRQQAEDEAMEKSKQEEAEAAAVEARRKKYHERQKEKLIERALAMNGGASGSDAQQPDATKTSAKTQVEKHKTQRQLEAEEKIRRLHLSLEERPPVLGVNQNSR